MITYEYTDVNRLRYPHKYMYTPYQGKEFVFAYFKDREENIKQFKTQVTTEHLYQSDLYICKKSELYLSEGCQVLNTKSIKPVSYFDKKNMINSEEMLLSLIFSQLSKVPDPRVKDWLDFLVQRFEVTKKVHEIYHLENSRKGDGDPENTRLYWLFSLLLTLYYSATNNIKYLSANLKINDLLCSLNEDNFKTVPKQGILFVLNAEVKHIKILFNHIIKEVAS